MREARSVEPFLANVGKRLVKSPKLYFNDTGLLCFLLGLSAEALGNSPLTGAVWENFVFTELAKWLALYRPEWTLWFYRDQQNREADFLLQGPFERVRLMDAKWAELPKSDSFDPLQRIADLIRRVRGVEKVEVALVSRTEGIRQLGEAHALVSAFALAEYLDRE